MLIPKEVLETVRAADTESTQYALGGVHFSRDAAGKPWAAATDSRMLIAFTWDDSGDDNPNVVVPAPLINSIRDAAKAVRGPADASLVIQDDGRVELGLQHRMQTTTCADKPADGMFPNYPDFMPTEDAIKLRVLLRVDLLLTVAKFLRAAFPDEDAVIEMSLIDSETAVRFVGRSGYKVAQVLLCPVIDDGKEWPKEAPRPAQPETKKAKKTPKTRKKPARKTAKKKTRKK